MALAAEGLGDGEPHSGTGAHDGDGGHVFSFDDTSVVNKVVTSGFGWGRVPLEVGELYAGCRMQLRGGVQGRISY
ncbi:hypothetical protein Apa02nite_033580 [Actinoplanes palleronii]|uniref:Uncharacterized protein n=1 Tax=Actinoplanes palleronii TaxID=113570 RepID=A0ABQ4B9B7_9ACTN|nr:hypothetical protein Apa02nite_033580 [Actinoplanes palleronii]